MLEDWSAKIRAWERAIHTWIIGPGLGRCRYMNRFFPRLINGLPSGCVAVFDADGIYYLDQHP
jgi:NAD(P)H-hydrate repair Nnr-like enzyme with NAD(P)H-hydrate dehydratase domain